MLNNLFNHFQKKQNAMKLYLEFPKIVDRIRQDDVNFRVKLSPTAITLKLYHKDSNHTAAKLGYFVVDHAQMSGYDKYT